MKTISALLGGLTDEDLNQWAGAKVHQRGQGYVDRVEGLQRTANNELVAWVRGTKRYATLVHLNEGGEYEWLCTCPCERGPCKHAVAVVIAAAQISNQDTEIPLLAREDDLARTLFNGEAGPAEGGGGPGGTAAVARPDEVDLQSLLADKSREELLALLVSLAASSAQVAQAIVEAEQLRRGQIEPLVRALGEEIDRLTKEPVWSDRRQGDGRGPDYAHVRHQFRLLLDAGKSDVLLDLGERLWLQGAEQVEDAEDDGETAAAIAACLTIVLEALTQSSLNGPQRLGWLLDRLPEDEFGLLHEGERLLNSGAFTAADWREATGRLEARLTARGRDAARSDQQRQDLMDRLVQAYRRSDQEEKIIPLLEQEVEQLGTYRQLAAALLATGNHARARQWCLAGFARTVQKMPATADALQGQLRLIAAAEERYDLVAAHRGLEFFRHHSLELYKELRKAAEKQGCWPEVHVAVLDYLHTGRRPDLAAKGAAPWPLPAPEVLYPQDRSRTGQRELFPDRTTLIDIALFEKRFDDAIALFGEMGKERIAALGLGRVVARAVAKTHPEVALTIWRGILDRLIAEATPRAYTEAGAFLAQMRKVYKACGREADWQTLLAGLRRTHRAKQQLLAVLTGLAEAGRKVVG